MYRLIFYTTERGDAPALEFLNALSQKPRAKIERVMTHLAALGPDLPRPYADVLRGKIRELRVGFGRLQPRLLYFFDLKEIVIVSGFLKKTDSVPEDELARAERRMADWLAR